MDERQRFLDHMERIREDELRNYRVYGLVDPREPKHVRYVGYTKRLRKRLWAHVASPRLGFTPVARWIGELAADGVRPKMKVLARGRGAEEFWIAELLRRGHRLLNANKLPYSARFCEAKR